uniref:Phospholipase A2 n=1 Tax=Heliothis virescens TaxID=7102 RepID=A0A2A4JUN0_HELVI
MELKSPKAKKKSSIAKLISWGRMFKTPLLILFLLGTTNCERESEVTELDSNFKIQTFEGSHLRHRHNNETDRNKMSEIKYLRRHLNRDIVNFVMTDYLIDGEVENRVHYNGVTAKETYVGADGLGLKLRQLTDGRHLVQVIYSQNGDIQDCEFITQGKSARNFLKTLRKELKLALDEEIFRIVNKQPINVEDEKFYRHFGNVTFRILKDGDRLPPDISNWLDYDKLKMECLKRHEELKYMMENKNKVGDVSLARSRRSFRENFIVPGTKWCGAGHIAAKYGELGHDAAEDRCCRSHDHCRFNIGMFKRRFGYFNYRPYTISHCRCDRRFRACLKLADTSVSNMVGKLFFNVVQTKCFILKPVKMCTQRSWWGKCLRRGYTKQAYLRDNLPY